MISAELGKPLPMRGAPAPLNEDVLDEPEARCSAMAKDRTRSTALFTQHYGKTPCLALAAL